jgi:hypothetical protein
MTALASRRRKHTLAALAAGLLAAVLAPTLVYVGAKAISNSKAGKNALEDVLPEQAFPRTPTAMLAVVSDSNALTSLTVFVLAPDSDVTGSGYDQRGGSIVSIPVNVDIESGDQLLSLGDAYAQGGVDALRLGLESAINLGIDSSAVMHRDELAAFLGGLPSVTVDLPRDVIGADDKVLYPKGSTELSTSQMAEILTTNAPTAAERLRRPNVDAVWAAIASAMGTGRQGQILSAASPTNFVDTAARLMAGSIASRGLVARPIPTERNPDQLDIEALDRPDTVLVFASIAPAQMSRPGTGLTYRLEAPPGYDAQVRKTIALLLSSDGNVVSVELGIQPAAQTVFQIYDSEIAAAEPTDSPVFGKITIKTPDFRLAGVDETISLGTDYLDKVDLTAPDATSTSLVPTETTG